MGNVSELQEAKNWIYDKLSANTDITGVVSSRIFADNYPGSFSTRTFPYILYNYQGGGEIRGVGKNRQASEPLFQIRVVTQGAPDTNAKLVDKRIDDVLSAATSDVSGDYYFSAERIDPVDRAEYDATNQRFHNLGGIYRVWIRRTV